MVVAALLVVGAVFVIAQRTMQNTTWNGPGMHFGMRHGGGRGMMMGLRQLNLTDEQKAKVKEIIEANRATMEPIRDAMRANHEKLAAMKGTFDEAAVTPVATEQGNLMAQMIVARQKVKSEIFAILTDEQKAKAEQLQQQMKERFRKGPGFGRPDAPKTDED